ncbi:hypothetical protein [Methylobacterium sp. 17Sr1-1]|uniref:hypothetical protein n=1 Tax=Methylobacterium sp. 17Sr1-1 TaxID=2202826 RepID=UPI001FE1D80C|nr:hypothetical protein [Methylobacterium sp. 17Sr1-1]
MPFFAGAAAASSVGTGHLRPVERHVGRLQHLGRIAMVIGVARKTDAGPAREPVLALIEQLVQVISQELRMVGRVLQPHQFGQQDRELVAAELGP